MAIVSSELKFYKSSSGVGLGGAISGVEIVTATMNSIFDNVSGAEAVAGDIEYRCVYFKNTNATITLDNAVVHISVNTPSTSTAVAIGISAAGVNGVETPVVDESTAPGAVVFSAAPAYATGVSLGSIPAGGHIGIWIQRTVTAGAAAYNNDGFTLTVTGETTA